MIEDLAVIGTSLKTATAGTAPPPTRSTHDDPFSVPPPNTYLSCEIILETLFQSHPLRRSMTTFLVAVHLVGKERGAPVVAANDVFSAFHTAFPDALDINGAPIKFMQCVRPDQVASWRLHWLSNAVDGSRPSIDSQSRRALPGQDRRARLVGIRD